MLGLVLTAGGARGAYQAGVLKRLGEARALRNRPSPFAVIAGASAGAINGTMVAATSADFTAGTRHLAKLWADLTPGQVFRSDLMSLGPGGANLVRDLSLGGLIGGGHVRSLLDARPLRALLAQHMPMTGIGEAIRAGHLYAIGLSATSYHSGKSFTFIQGRKGHPMWLKSRRVALAVELAHEHVCASAAIPIVFAPVRVNSPEVGECWFGDGGMRLVTPFSPAIRLGARRIFAVGIRCQSSADALSRAELRGEEEGLAGRESIAEPPLAQICGVFLNAIFLDHLDTDLDHLVRMNELIAAGHHSNGNGRKRRAATSEPMRRIEPFVLNPSADLAIVAAAFAHKMPRAVRYVMDGLGTPNAQSADLMSYLLFDSSYTRALIDIGYQDASARVDELEAFLLAA